jgi:hypothetical protein
MSVQQAKRSTDHRSRMMRCADEYSPATVSKSPAAARMAQSNLSRLRCSGPV